MDRSPYAPPAVPVEVRRPWHRGMPFSLWIALVLLAIVAALDIADALRWIGRFHDISGFLGLVIPAIDVALIGWIAIGHNWARIVTAVIVICSLVLFVLSTVEPFMTMPEGVKFQLSPSALIIATLPQMANVIAIALLLGPARAWFRAKSR